MFKGEDGTDRGSQNINKELPLRAVYQLRRVEFSSTEVIYVTYCTYVLIFAGIEHFKNNTWMVSHI